MRFTWMALLLIALVLLSWGAWQRRFTPLLAGSLTMGLAAWRGWLRWVPGSRQEHADRRPPPVPVDSADKEVDQETDHDQQADQLVEESLREHRSGLLLQPQVAAALTLDQLTRTLRQFNESASIVPRGGVGTSFHVAEIRGADAESSADGQTVARQQTVETFYLDRYTVTNRRFQDFVDAGGYQKMEYWPTEIWPEVLDFVDQTGQPGPRYWHKGKFPEDRASHPVVGVSWYEALAYANWAGRRLPTDAEWLKAASWPVEVDAGQLASRRYPWGDVLDQGQANVWSAAVGGTAEVDAFPNGASASGLYQLAGNVWEWTADDAGEMVETAMIAGGNLILPGPMKIIRGGAFDTYFENQASCDYRSVARPTDRKYNIGFRCAVTADQIVDVTRDVHRLATTLQAAGSRSDTEGAAVLEECSG
ncbi:MAG: SUMF1/EgtB/PvdO family nonheme iron enzyme [Planctomycetales bacterium]|nr:SUMF1/EgtB/PvdO family nonheme iron enzyme [Planctomycetales bacterium]